MESVPKPAYLKIVLPDKEHLARSSPDELFVLVRLKWRQPASFEGMPSVPAEMWKLPDAEEFEVLRRADSSYTLVPTTWRRKPFRFGKGRPTFYELERAGRDMGWGKSFEYVSNLIKQYQPEFDYTVSEESADYLLHIMKRCNDVSNSVIALHNHLQYTGKREDGTYKKKPAPPRADPDKDVRAAILSDVMGMSTLRIREQLGLSRVWKKQQEASTLGKREDRTVGTAIQRGRALLEHFFGVEEWREKVERMRKKRAEWLELEDQPKQQIYYLLAERHGTSIAVEELAARHDGFDRLLEDWIAAWEQDDPVTANKIRDMDSRFQEAIDQV